MCRHDDDIEIIADTVGRAIPGVELKIVDDDGNDAPAGEPGEVLMRGYNVMKGYFDNPERHRRGHRRRRLVPHRRHRHRRRRAAT